MTVLVDFLTVVVWWCGLVSLLTLVVLLVAAVYIGVRDRHRCARLSAERQDADAALRLGLLCPGWSELPSDRQRDRKGQP